MKFRDNEWKKVKISELGKIITGKTPSTKDEKNFGGSIPFLTPSDNMDVRYVEATARTLSDEGVNKVKNSLLPSNSICVSCIGSQLGKVVVTTEETVTNQQINSIVPNKKTDFLFLYYLMLMVGKQLNYLSKTSTAVPIVNKTEFSNIEVMLPPKQTQIKISSLLSSLDSKIEVNNKIIANLEEQAQAIFKSWFIDYEPFQDGEFVESELGLIPKGWEVATIKGFASIEMGQSPKSEHYNSDGLGLPFLQGVRTFGDIFPTIDTYTTKAHKIAEEGDILFTVRAPVGDLNIAPSKLCIGRGLAAISSDNQEFLYFLLKNNKNKYKNLSTGTIYSSINKTTLENTKFANPAKKYMSKYQAISFPMFESIKNLQKQNQKLAQTRDALLPKLMSGEIDVSNIEIDTGEESHV